MHSLTQFNSEQSNMHTATGVSPTISNSIYFILKILLIQYLIHCYTLQTYSYMQTYHHRINHTPMQCNKLFYQSVRVSLASTDNELPEDGVTTPKHADAILM